MADLNIRAILKDEFSAQTEKLVAELKKVEAAGKEADRSISGVDSVVKKSGASAETSAFGWANFAGKLFALQQAAGVASTAILSLVDASSRYDSITVRLNAFEGSAEAGARAFEKLQTLAKQPGLGLEQAASAYAGLRALKESGPEAVKIIEAIAKANASMGGGADEFGRAMNQIQQMLGKGKLMAEDINTISESIPNFRGLMLEAFGTVDTKVLNTKYSIQELLKGIEDAAAKLPKPGETIKNNLDNIGDAWTRMWAAVGGGYTIKTATSNLAKLIDKAAELSETLKKANEEKMKFFSEREDKKNASDHPTATMWPMDFGEIGHIPDQPKKKIKGWGELHPGEKLPTPKPKPSSPIAAPRGEWVNYLDDSEMTNVKYRWNQDRGGSGKEQAEESKRVNKIKDDDLKKELRRIEKENEAELDKQKEIDQIKSDFDKRQVDRAREKHEKIARIATQYSELAASTLADGYTKMWNDFQRDGEITFAGIYDAFSEMVTKMVLEMAAKATIFGLFNVLSGGQGNLLGGASSFIFGARASGGVMFPGVPYRFNEDRYNGSGGEVFRPASGGSASPDRGRGGGGTTTHYHFAAGTTKSDSGAIVRAIQQATRERSRSATRRG